jgi:hypothetical protein
MHNEPPAPEPEARLVEHGFLDAFAVGTLAGPRVAPQPRRGGPDRNVHPVPRGRLGKRLDSSQRDAPVRDRRRGPGAPGMRS